jgi:hypothetical protein
MSNKIVGKIGSSGRTNLDMNVSEFEYENERYRPVKGTKVSVITYRKKNYALRTYTNGTNEVVILLRREVEKGKKYEYVSKSGVKGCVYIGVGPNVYMIDEKMDKSGNYEGLSFKPKIEMRTGRENGEQRVIIYPKVLEEV